MTAIKETEKYKRLHPEDTEQKWRKWGPYLSNRQWGTVREHYSNDKPAWGAFTYDQARSIAYRWGEDGILGISDDTQELCFALALWNGQQDDHIKERFFGLPGLFGEHGGIHGEDVKEYYFYLDSTPTHSYMKALYKYPATQFPIADLIEKNDSRRERGKSEPEYELIDTGIFEKGYFDITVEYAKAQWDDILIKIEVVNRSIHGKSQLHLLPTLWFRNTWSWKNNEGRPDISEQNGALCAEYNRDKKKMYLHYEMLDEFHGVYFTDNESETGENRRPPITGRDEIITSRFFKNGIDRYLTGQDYTNRNNPDFISNWINPNRNGTKASVHYSREFSKETDCWRIRLRLSSRLGDNDRFGDFDEHLERCRQEANDFFDALTPPTPPPHFVKIIEKGEKVEEKWDDWRNIQRQALAGLLWSKQYYHYDVDEWLSGNPNRKDSINHNWLHIRKKGIFCVPDKWEYPYFAAWDSGFQAIPMALVDPDFAKKELLRLTQSDYMNLDGKMPGCEFGFDEISPPVHAWAAWKVYEIDKEIYGEKDGDKAFLKKISDRLWYNFLWWVNTKKLELAYWVPPEGFGQKPIKKKRAVYSAGFLGLDNISVIDRNQQTADVKIEELDAASWMAMYCLNMMKIFCEVEDVHEARETCQERALHCLREFISLANELNTTHRLGGEYVFWDNDDKFYYEILRISPEDHTFTIEMPLRYRSILSLIPVFAVETFLETNTCESCAARIRSEVFDQDGNFKENRDRHLSYLLGHDENIKVPAEGEGHSPLVMFSALVGWTKLRAILERALDEEEFLSRFGVRSLSKLHGRTRYGLDGAITNRWGVRIPIEMNYEPAETQAPIHVGNSNWRGPIWFPLNYLLIDSLKKYNVYLDKYCGYHDTRVAFPTRSEDRKTLSEVATALSLRLISIFSRNKGHRPVHGYNDKIRDRFEDKPQGNQFPSDGWGDLVLFFEHFNGDTGAGLGASHQTGWTALVANLIDEFVRVGSDELSVPRAELDRQEQA